MSPPPRWHRLTPAVYDMWKVAIAFLCPSRHSHTSIVTRDPASLLSFRPLASKYDFADTQDGEVGALIRINRFGSKIVWQDSCMAPPQQPSALSKLPTKPPPAQVDAKFPIYVSGSCSHEILASPDKDFKLPEGGALLGGGESKSASFQDDSFKSHLYFQNTSTSLFGAQLLWSPRLPSTHTLLSQNFHVLPLGTVCVADTQVSGKGRSNNVWESPKGCLMFSFTLQMDNGHMLPFLQYVVSIALIDAIQHVSLLKGLPSLPVNIKWPNDIYANGLKIGGVLCTSTYRDKKFDVVAGIGLNVGNQKPTTCLDALLQELVCEAPLYKREELLAACFVKFEGLFKIFNSDGFGLLEKSYYEKWLHSGQEVVLEERQKDNSTVRIYLTIKGLSSTGYLLATDDQMEAYELHPDGNSFDFLKGLMRTELQP